MGERGGQFAMHAYVSAGVADPPPGVILVARYPLYPCVSVQQVEGEDSENTGTEGEDDPKSSSHHQQSGGERRGRGRGRGRGKEGEGEGRGGGRWQ